MTFRLTCYDEPYANIDTITEAKATANAHIRSCPEGAMEWANRIEWHEVGPVPEAPNRHAWVSASRGEWLNHRIDVIETEVAR